MAAKREDKLTDEWITDHLDKIFQTPKLDMSRMVMETTWFRNTLYYLGEQWFDWMDTSLTFQRRFPISSTIPTPVSNGIRDYVRSMKALVLNKRYTVRVWPNSNEQSDKDAALLGGQMLQWMDSLDDFEIEDVKEWIALWMVLAGNGFARVYAEVDDGLYISDKAISKGQVAVDPLLPFNVLVAPIGIRMDKKAWVGVKSLKYKEWVEDTHKILISHKEQDMSQIDYERQLLKMVANVSPWKGRGLELDVMGAKTEELVLYQEVEYAPTRDYPKGRYVVRAGTDIVKKVPHLPIPVDEKSGKFDFTVVHFPYNHTPGSMWATGGVDDLISPQNTINETDQSAAINRKSFGRPFLLSPAQVTLRRLSARGQSMLAVEYDGRNAGGAKPQIHPGTPYPSQLFEERKIQREVMQDAGGDPKNILKGQSPHSGASGVMVDTLREAAEMSHSPDIARFYRNWSKVQRKRLTVAQSLFSETRMLKIPGEGNKVFVRAFKGADLRNNTDVRLELDSSLSSTQAGRNEILLKLIQGTTFFGDLHLQPRLRREVGRRMGMGTLPDEENLHQDKAEKENAIFAYGKDSDILTVALPNAPIKGQDGQPMLDPSGTPITLFPKSYDPTFRFDNHAVHIKVLLEFILSKEFTELPKNRQRYAIGHLDMHKDTLEEIDRQNMLKMAEKTQMGAIESGGSPAPPAPMAGPEGMMPESTQMQGQEGGMKPSYGNY